MWLNIRLKPESAGFVDAGLASWQPKRQQSAAGGMILTLSSPGSDPIQTVMILQLNPTILVETPLGQGNAIFIIDYGMHQNTCWVVALNKNGVIKHFDCNDVIISTNYTYGMNLMRNMNHPPEQKPGLSNQPSPQPQNNAS